MSAALMAFGMMNASAQVNVTPEAGFSIYKDGARSGSVTTVSPRIGLSVDYFFNKKNTGWGIMSGLHFYQKRNRDSFGTLRFVNDKGEEMSTPFQPNPSVGNGGYGNGLYGPGGYGDTGSGLNEDMHLKSISSHYVNTRRDYLQLPVMLTYKWQMNDTYSLSFAAGAYVAVGVGGKQKTDLITYETEGNKVSRKHNDTGAYDDLAYKRFETGFSSRVSFQANRLSINLNYETNLNRRYNWTNHDNLISLTAGYSF